MQALLQLGPATTPLQVSGAAALQFGTCQWVTADGQARYPLAQLLGRVDAKVQLACALFRPGIHVQISLNPGQLRIQLALNVLCFGIQAQHIGLQFGLQRIQVQVAYLQQRRFPCAFGPRGFNAQGLRAACTA